MQYHHVKDILVSPNRQRRLFDVSKQLELSESLKKRMLHPIVVRASDAGPVLVAGERRLKAVQDLAALAEGIVFGGELLPPGIIPCVDTGALNEIEREEAELEENIRRVDLTWQERASATSRLAALRTKISDSQGLPPPTTREIAEEVRGSGEGSFQEATRRELIVARHLHDPEVKQAKTLDDAFKTIKRKEESAKNQALSVEVGRNFGAHSHRAEHTDALGWLVTCPADAFDVILTDPPYGMGADEFGDSGGRTGGEHRYSDNADSFTRVLSICQTELFRIAKAQAHLYWFCDIDQFHVSREAFSIAGWWVHRTPLIWHKPANVRIPWPEHGPQRKYELILYAVKGKRKTTFIAPDVITESPDANLGHQAQKPVALFADLLKRSVHPGDTVLDPFMGTGTIFPAAHILKCRATGIERDDASYGIAVKRLKALDIQSEIFDGAI
jgi:site-specific DNA-methyltransferase (adenine-specific)